MNYEEYTNQNSNPEQPAAPMPPPTQPSDELRTTQPPTKPPGKPQSRARRNFLQGALASGALLAGGALVYSTRDKDEESANDNFDEGTQDYGSDPLGSVRSDAQPGRVLVVVELQGGNDGLSMVVPYTSGTYYDSRPNIAIPQEEVLKINDTIGLHPNLTRLHERGIKILQGVGSKQDSLSHFDCEQLWQVGDVTGEQQYRSGFLARCVDPLDVGAPITGLAVGGQTPYFNSSRAPAIAISNTSFLNYLANDNDWALKEAFHESLKTFGSDIEDSYFDVVNKTYANLLDMGSIAGQEFVQDETNPMITDGGGLGRQLNVAADLIGANTGVRVVHARLGRFDTHTNQRGTHDQLMAQLDAAIAGFLQKAEEDGFADRVLVAVFSEFGRRVAENDRGTDHGQASNLILAGAIEPGIMGELNVADMDDRGNLKTSIPFDSLQRTCAEWLGIEGESIFPDSKTEILFT